MARVFDGSNANRLAVGDVAAVDITTQYLSVFCWFRPSTVDANERALIAKARYDGTSVQYVLSFTSGGGINFQIGDGSGFDQAGGGTIIQDQWNGAVGVKRGGAIESWVGNFRAGRVFRNAASSSRTPSNYTYEFRLGVRDDGGGGSFSGYMAHAAIWSAALTEEEIVSLLKGANPLMVQPGALNGYWPLDDYGSSGEARDYSKYNNTLTMAGSVGFYATPSPFYDTYDLVFGGPVVAQPISPPFFNIGTGTFVPTVTETGIVGLPFFNIGTGLYEPRVQDFINPPFLNVGTGLMPVTMFEGGMPPFVPPSLPATIPPGTPTGPGIPLPPLSSGGLAGIRFYQGPPWRWLVTDLETNTITFLDKLATGATITYGLDRGSNAKVSVPSDNPEVNILHTDGEPFVSEGNRLLYGFRREGDGPLWQCRFAGKVLQVEDTGEAENAQTIITAFDPWHTTYQLPMINFDGEFPDTAGFFSFDDTQTGVICLTFLRNAIVNSGEIMGIDMGDNDFATVDNMPGTSYWGGPYEAVWSGRTKSKYETTTQIDTDCQQGMMVGEVWEQQLQTGTLDIMLTPIYDPVRRPGYMAELSIYERVGRQADDAVFAWDKPSRNLDRIDVLKDGTKRANTIRYYEQQGGQAVNSGIPISYGPSITKYGETWHQQFYPGRIMAAVYALETLQLDLLQDGIKTVEWQPTPERMPFLFTEWWLGDTVPIYASDKLRAEVAGFQRIYGIVLSIDENSFEQVPQVLTSPDSA